MRKQIVSATVSVEAFNLKKKLKKRGINFSPFVEELIFELANKNGIDFK